MDFRPADPNPVFRTASLPRGVFLPPRGERAPFSCDESEAFLKERGGLNPGARGGVLLPEGEKRKRKPQQAQERRKVMKKVLAAILVGGVVAAMPAAASASGSTSDRGGILIPGKLPPSGFPGKGNQGSSPSATSNRGRRGPLPPVASK
jgi:hypothetical protein